MYRLVPETLRSIVGNGSVQASSIYRPVLPFIPKIKPEEWDTKKNETQADIDRSTRAPGSGLAQASRLKRRRSNSRELAVPSSSTSTSRSTHSSLRNVSKATSSESASVRPLLRQAKVVSMTTSKAVKDHPNAKVSSTVVSNTTSKSSQSVVRREEAGRRLWMQSRWNASLPRGSAKLYLVNTEDDEDCPPLLKGFTYSENAYTL